jgi:hypothetical protein
LGILYGSDRFLQTPFTGSFTVLQARISFTGFYRKLYGHGIQSFLLCVLSIALSVTSVLTTDPVVVLGLYAVLSIALHRQRKARRLDAFSQAVDGRTNDDESSPKNLLRIDGIFPILSLPSAI